MRTPIALLVFNRPELTRRVFEVVRQIQPEHLLVVADGPRSNHPSDPELCQEVRSIVEKVDWPCELKLNFRVENLGCRLGVTKGIDWVFELVDRAIILEDDCLPDSSFFPFCEELLERYENNPQVGMISGDNFLNGKYATSASYYFSRHCHIWGWATWRRAWQQMDLAMADWAEVRKTHWLEKKTGSGPQKHFWSAWFDDSYRGADGALNTWDVAWTYACWRNDLRCIIPRVNLVENIGFGIDSTHTHVAKEVDAKVAARISFPLQHPVSGNYFAEADDFTELTRYYGASFTQRVLHTLRLPIRLKTVVSFRNKLSSVLPKPH